MTDPAASRWIVLTPSADNLAWRHEIARAAAEAGLVVIDGAEDAGAPPEAIRITQDAALALGAGASRIVALMPEPTTASEAVGDATGLETPSRDLHASLLLARAAALAPVHPVITAEDLAKKPAALTLFGALRLVPPRSRAELSRDPAMAAAFQIYAATAPARDHPVVWAQPLFTHDARSLQGSIGPGVLDTTGRPRLMVSGPYLYLPPGAWRACIRFGVDAAAAKRQYRLDWGTRTEFVSEHVTPGAPGVYELELDFTWNQVDEAEMRLFIMEGSFTGTLIFQGMSVRPVAETTAAAA